MRIISAVAALIVLLFTTAADAQTRDISEELHLDGLKTLTTQLSRDFKLDLDKTAPLNGLTTIKLEPGSDRNALVLINDMPIEPVLAAEYDFAHIGVIERVNILRGDQSAGFGDNARGGVIKIKTRGLAADDVPAEPDLQSTAIAENIAAFEPVTEISRPDPQPDPTKAEPVTVKFADAEIFKLNSPASLPNQKTIKSGSIKTVVEPVPQKVSTKKASTGNPDYGAIFDRLQEEKRRKAQPVDMTKLYADLRAGSLETRQCKALATHIQKGDKAALGEAMNAAISKGFGGSENGIANCQFRSDISGLLCDAPERDKSLLMDSEFLYLNYHFLKYAPTAICGSKTELANQYIKIAAGNHAGAQYIYANMLYSQSLQATANSEDRTNLERESFILFHKSADQGNGQSITALKSFFDYDPKVQSAE